MAVISFEIMENNRYGCYPRIYSKFYIADFVGWTSVLAQDMTVISNLWIVFTVEFFLADPKNALRTGNPSHFSLTYVRASALQILH